MEVRVCRSEGLASFSGSPGMQICTSSISCSRAEEPGNEARRDRNERTGLEYPSVWLEAHQQAVVCK